MDAQPLFAFDNSYAALPDGFHARLAPTPVPDPSLIALNDALAAELGLDPERLKTPDGLAVLAGNAVPDGADPIAQAYAGHQFGGWVPQLGDGRAILLGEVIDQAGVRRDIQLKGSGPTPFSRRGDGRAWLGPVLREYIVSEAMHALGVPTTRALAAVSTGETVIRERPLPGAVLTRIASSHIRVGTFQFFAARQDLDALRRLTDHVIARHYPDAKDAMDLLRGVVARQAALVAQWMSLGFIHGVMNTDNCHVAGETIDYGPCAFMDDYHPMTVFSSIDQYGRYAYARQPEIAAWNLAQLASSLLPILGSDRLEEAQAAIDGYADLYAAEWLSRFRAKLGLTSAEDGDADLIQALLTLMAEQGADFTNTFRALANGRPEEVFKDPAVLDSWLADWTARRDRDPASTDKQAEVMRRANPSIIPRNHRVEEVIAAATNGDLGPFHALHAALQNPWDHDGSPYALPPRPEEKVAATFCGT